MVLEVNRRRIWMAGKIANKFFLNPQPPTELSRHHPSNK